LHEQDGSSYICPKPCSMQVTSFSTTTKVVAGFILPSLLLSDRVFEFVYGSNYVNQILLDQQRALPIRVFDRVMVTGLSSRQQLWLKMIILQRMKSLMIMSKDGSPFPSFKLKKIK
jgi:hypothetical protein